MHKGGVGDFKYFVGINSLAEIATKEDRACVLNILGTESRTVTPTSHVWSGGNVVFGTGPGRTGQALQTELGPIPVYNSVKEGMAAGHTFNTGVVYLPPAGVKDGVSELIKHNKELKKIIIITEKISVKDAHTIRAIGQVNGIDIFGGNCLGVGDAWNKVRLGGALGGSDPGESLAKGSIALFSNSGNFTTTIAVYMQTQGWGTTTSISSGKDVYIHFAPHEFFHALDNDARSKAAVVYIEPGGYYEHGLKITKPTVACVVGRWKANLTHACGHAGSLAGSGDDAAAKEGWFKTYFGVDDIFTPENPVFSEKGAVVTNIAHIPAALTQVMALNGIEPDFEPQGDLSLKCWFADDLGLPVPKELVIPVCEALAPHDEQINLLDLQVGAQFPRQTLKDTSGASLMDPKTQVARLHGTPVLEAARKSTEANVVLALTKTLPGNTESQLANIALNAMVPLNGNPMLAAAEAARVGDASPNCVLATAVGILGKGHLGSAPAAMEVFLDIFQHCGLVSAFEPFPYQQQLDDMSQEQKDVFGTAEDDQLARYMLAAIKHKNADSLFIRFAVDAAGGSPTADVVLAAIWASIAWRALSTKFISRQSFVNLPWHSRVLAASVGAAVPARHQKERTFYQVPHEELIEHWSFGEVAFLSLIGRRPSMQELSEFQLLLGLLLTNGPGTISAQGCKGGVSSDGPEQPERVQINKAYLGFLSHTGYAHGGNGFEAIDFLLDLFWDDPLTDPCDPDHGLDLAHKANKYVRWYATYKKEQKRAGNLGYKKIPCINHPIFKDKEVNYDPRERFVSKLLKEQGSYNIFLDFYHHLVQALFENKVSKNTYCVNVDAVIAVLLLKILWRPYKEGDICALEMETAAFTTFLYGRMIGCAAEIDDHLSRGRNMDTRTPASRCFYVG